MFFYEGYLYNVATYIKLVATIMELRYGTVKR